MVRKLLRFNEDGVERVEVVILSRNDPVSGMRIFNSGAAQALRLERGVFTQGRAPFGYLRPLHADIFLSANAHDVHEALAAGFPAAHVMVDARPAGNSYPDELRIAFDGDAVLFSDEAEQVFQKKGLAAFQQHEAQGRRALPAGPFKPFRSPAPPAAGRPAGPAHPHRAGHRARRAGAPPRHPDADALEHPRGRGDVPGRPAQGRVPA
jgi:5'-nucleotidase